MQALPIPTAGPGREAPALAATGTDARPRHLGPNLDPQLAISGDFQRQTETETDYPRREGKPGKTKVFASFPGSDMGMSKMEPTGIEPVTSALRTLRSPS